MTSSRSQVTRGCQSAWESGEPGDGEEDASSVLVYTSPAREGIP